MKLSDDLLKGLLDDVILSHRNGKPYIKRRPRKVKNPKTKQQTQQRGRFGAASAFVSRNLDSLIRPYWNPEAKRQGMTGQNLFCKINTRAFDAKGNLNLEELVFTSGSLEGIDLQRTEFMADKGLRLIWEYKDNHQEANNKNLLKIFGIRDSLDVYEIKCSSLREEKECIIYSDLTQYSHLFMYFWNQELNITSCAQLVDLQNISQSAN